MPLALTLDLADGTPYTHRESFYQKLEVHGWVKDPVLTTFWIHPVWHDPTVAAASVRICALDITGGTTVVIQKAVVLAYTDLAELPSPTATR